MEASSSATKSQNSGSRPSKTEFNSPAQVRTALFRIRKRHFPAFAELQPATENSRNVAQPNPLKTLDLKEIDATRSIQFGLHFEECLGGEPIGVLRVHPDGAESEGEVSAVRFFEGGGEDLPEGDNASGVVSEGWHLPVFVTGCRY